MKSLLVLLILVILHRSIAFNIPDAFTSLDNNAGKNVVSRGASLNRKDYHNVVDLGVCSVSCDVTFPELSDRLSTWKKLETMEKRDLLKLRARYMVVTYNDEISNETATVLSIRGTKNFRNMRSNIDGNLVRDPLLDIHVHRGFQRIFQAILHDLNNTSLFRHLDANRGPFYVTGHSLGGAVACLLAAALHWKYQRSISDVVVFGIPKFTDKSGSAYLSRLPLTVVEHLHDPIVVTPISLPFSKNKFHRLEPQKLILLESIHSSSSSRKGATVPQKVVNSRLSSIVGHIQRLHLRYAQYFPKFQRRPRSESTGQLAHAVQDSGSSSVLSESANPMTSMMLLTSYDTNEFIDSPSMSNMGIVELEDIIPNSDFDLVEMEVENDSDDNDNDNDSDNDEHSNNSSEKERELNEECYCSEENENEDIRDLMNASRNRRDNENCSDHHLHQCCFGRPSSSYITSDQKIGHVHGNNITKDDEIEHRDLEGRESSNDHRLGTVWTLSNNNDSSSTFTTPLSHESKEIYVVQGSGSLGKFMHRIYLNSAAMQRRMELSWNMMLKAGIKWHLMKSYLSILLSWEDNFE